MFLLFNLLCMIPLTQRFHFMWSLSLRYFCDGSLSISRFCISFNRNIRHFHVKERKKFLFQFRLVLVFCVLVCLQRCLLFPFVSIHSTFHLSEPFSIHERNK